MEVVALLGESRKHDSTRSLLKDSVQSKSNIRYRLEDIHHSECFKRRKSANWVQSDICEIRTGTSRALEMRYIRFSLSRRICRPSEHLISPAPQLVKAFDILAPSATLWGEKDPERRDSLISTTALEAGKWVRTNIGLF